MLTRLYCDACHGMVMIQRKRGRGRKRGHKKTMWCPWCKGVRRFTQGRRSWQR